MLWRQVAGYASAFFLLGALLMLYYLSSLQTNYDHYRAPPYHLVEELANIPRRSASCDNYFVSKEEILRQLNAFAPVSDEIVRQAVFNDSGWRFDLKPPERFDTKYKSPCWRDVEGILLCLPYFYLSGFPKSATTDVWVKLTEHPFVGPSHPKEPHWWTRGGMADKGRTLRNYIERYRPFINAEKSKKHILGDGSCSTLFDNHGLFYHSSERYKNFTDLILDEQLINIQFIKAFTPNAKFIVMTRKPIDRMYSDYTYFGGSEINLKEFHKRVIDAIKLFKECLKNKYSIRHCTYYSAAYGEGRQYPRVSRIFIGLYVVYLSDLMKVFPRKNIMVVNLADYASNPKSTLNEMYTFLNVSQLSERALRKIFDSEKKNKQRPKIPPMFNKTKKALEDFYCPFNEALSELLKNDEYLFI